MLNWGVIKGIIMLTCRELMWNQKTVTLSEIARGKWNHRGRVRTYLAVKPFTI